MWAMRARDLATPGHGGQPLIWRTDRTAHVSAALLTPTACPSIALSGRAPFPPTSRRYVLSPTPRRMTAPRTAQWYMAVLRRRGRRWPPLWVVAAARNASAAAHAGRNRDGASRPDQVVQGWAVLNPRSARARAKCRGQLRCAHTGTTAF